MVVAGQRACIDVLGPLRARSGSGDDVTPTGALQRRALALLVLRRGRVTSTDALVDALWPGALPSDPVAAVQNHVSRLRRVLPPGAIESAGDGYRLDPATVDVDADRLAGALARDAPDLDELDATLSRWVGPAYPDLDEHEEGRAEAARLEELRVRAVEVRAAAQLRRGEVDEAIAALTRLVAEHPLRERPAALLVEALAACGRRVDALRAYDDLRRRLADELGLAPSAELQARHAQLLDGGLLDGGLLDGGLLDGRPLDGRDTGEWRPATRLPRPVSSIVGRDGEVADLLGLRPTARLVSLVGPGGVGKTRLLVELGHRLRDANPDVPVVWCELATADSDSAVDAVAAALGVDARPGVPLADRIVAALGDLEIVLLLDNCEHVLEPVAALVDTLLRRGAGTRVLTSTRERLRVDGEHVRVIAPLPTDAAGDSPAVQLFVERASAAAGDLALALDEPSRGLLADIVRRLDGLPLAIELAAARLHTLSLEEIAAGLDERFALLASGYRTSTRHGSLGAAVAWSYDLLDPSLQRAFDDLSVFADTFGVADAAAVTGLPVDATRRSLDQLTERSLVLRAAAGRWSLLETLRAFGTERLASSGRLEATGRRHAHHQLARIAELSAELRQAVGGTLDRVDAAVPELRAAFRWAIAHGEVELAGRIVVGLFDYAFLRLRPDIYEWSSRVLDADPEDTSPVAAEVWVAAGYAAWMAGDLTGMLRCVQRATSIAQRRGGPLPASVLEVTGTYDLVDGRVVAALEWYRRATERAAATGEEGLRLMSAASELLALGYAGDPAVGPAAAALLDEVGDRRTPHAAFVWYCAGEADLAIGADIERARARLMCARELADATHATLPSGLASATLASMEARWGDADRAAAEYRRLLIQWRRAGMWSTQWTMLRSIAGLLARLGRDHEAAVLVGAVRATDEGHRIFGSDEVELAELAAQLRDRLGAAAFEHALRDGARLDGAATVEHALRSL